MNNSIDILVLNAGSSSFKSSLYRLTRENLPLDPVVPLWTGEINWSSSGSVLKAKTADESISNERTQTNRTADIHD
jgi:acetate kinase